MNRNLIENRQIRVFISSTFRDMQDERDYLMRYTFPRIREIAAARDVSVTELDLRWGITQEEAQSGAVVDICLKEIENSIPFFIGIIGNRYGWIPSENDVRRGTVERFSQVKDYLESRLSVTEMEMQFGVLQREEDMHAYFYIKDYNDEYLHPEWGGVEPEDSRKRLAKLVEEVKSSRYPSSTYSSKDDLCEQVEQAFVSLLDQLFPLSIISEQKKERIAQQSFKNRLCQSFVIPDNHFRALDAWLTNNNSKVLAIEGYSGVGKSSLIANWLTEKETHTSGYHIVSHFIGNGGCSGTKEYVSDCIARDICQSYGWDLHMTLADTLSRISSFGEPLLIVVDAVNQLLDVDDAKLLNWLPIPPNNVKVLFTTIPDDRTSEVFKWRGYDRYYLSPYSAHLRKQMASSYLRLYAKTLSDDQLERIISHPLCGNTFVLRTVLDELINFGYFEKLDERIDYLISKNKADEFFGDYLDTYERIYGIEGTSFIQEALSLIALSNYGLSEDEILALAKVKQLHWSQFYCSFKNNFIVKNGLIDFSHDHIRRAVLRRYLNDNSEWEGTCRNTLIHYFGSQESVRTWDELPYQLFILKDNDRLFTVLSDERCFFRILERDPRSLWSYWNSLIVSSGYSLEVYLSTVSPDYMKDCSIAQFVSMYSHDTGLALKYMLRARRNLCDGAEEDYLMKMGDVLVESSPGEANIYYRKAANLLMSGTKTDDSKLAYCTLQIAVSNDWEGVPVEIPIKDLDDGKDAAQDVQVSYSAVHNMKDLLKDLFISFTEGINDEDDTFFESTEPSCEEHEKSDVYDELLELKELDSVFPEYQFDFEKDVYGEELQKTFFEEAVSMYRKAGMGEDSLQIGECYMKLYEILWLTDHPEETVQYLDKAYSIYTRMKTPRCSEVIAILRSKAKVYTNLLFDNGGNVTTPIQGDIVSTDTIENLYSEVLDSTRYIYGLNSVNYAEALEEYAEYFDSVENFSKEQDCYIAIRDIYHNLRLHEEEQETQRWIDTYLKNKI